MVTDEDILAQCFQQSDKGKFHDQFFRRKAQNLRAEKVLSMRIEILIFATKKLLCASELNHGRLRPWLNFFQLTGEIKKRNQSNSSIFTKKNRWRIFQNQSKMEDTEHTFCRGMYSSGNIAPRKNCADKICS